MPQSSESLISVVLLTGEKLSIPISTAATVLQLKNSIAKIQGIPKEKQKLIFGENEPQVDSKTLHDYEIQPYSKVFLLIIMFSIPSNFDHVVFDLFWGYPVHGRDYLDASCLAFANRKHVGTVDYSNTTFSTSKSKIGRHPFGILAQSLMGGASIRHSGDVMDDRARQGHHTINVQLKQLPKEVTHLFFTLSAYSSPSISHYPNPSLKFYEASKKSVDLCSTSFSHAINSQAVIMCSVSKKGDVWEIYRSGKLTSGNVRNYNPIVSTIQGLIASGI